MKYVTLYTNDDGTSHFREVEVKFESVNFAPPAPPVGLSDYIPLVDLSFLRRLLVGLEIGILRLENNSFAASRASLKQRRAMVKCAFLSQVTCFFSKIRREKAT